MVLSEAFREVNDPWRSRVFQTGQKSRSITESSVSSFMETLLRRKSQFKKFFVFLLHTRCLSARSRIYSLCTTFDILREQKSKTTPLQKLVEENAFSAWSMQIFMSICEFMYFENAVQQNNTTNAEYPNESVDLANKSWFLCGSENNKGKWMKLQSNTNTIQ